MMLMSHLNRKIYYLSKITESNCKLCLRFKKPRYSLRNMATQLEPNHLQMARLFWVQNEQKEIAAELEKGILGKGKFHNLNVKRSTVDLYGNNELVIIPVTHRFARLYATFIHSKAHRGVRADVAMIRTEYWIRDHSLSTYA